MLISSQLKKRKPFYIFILFFITIIMACNNTKHLNAQEITPIEEPQKESDSLVVLNQLNHLKDSLLLRKNTLEEEQKLIYQRISDKRAEIDAHDKEFRQNSPEYKAMLPTYMAVTRTRDNPEYKRITSEMALAQEKINANPQNNDYKKAYDEKLKEFKNWENESGRTALKMKLLPLRAKFLEAEANSGRTALGQEIQNIEKERIRVRDILKNINTQIATIESQIQTLLISK